jgi:enoyl-CoA hydratase
VSVEVRAADGIAEVIIDFPPVNALPVQGWFDLAAAVAAAGADAETRAVILAAAGRGFCAGVDIKEMQRTQAAEGGHEALLGANRGCAAAFAAVYDCAVPVIAAVHGFCLGGGVGLAGNADIVIAAQDATFGLPEVDRGALGAATHLSRLVPQQLMRTMVYTCRTVTAAQLLSFGTVLEVVPAGELRAAARAVAAEIAAKDPAVIRLAKRSLNGIDPVDVRRSYRYEQGFTFELNLAGAGDAARQAFVDGR